MYFKKIIERLRECLFSLIVARDDIASFLPILRYTVRLSDYLSSMKIYTAAQTAEKLAYPKLIDNIRKLFANDVRCPDRHSHSVGLADEKDGTLLLMSGWHEDIGCVKIVNVTPENGKRHLPAVVASILVFRRSTGEHVAILDGDTVTVRRTAAASALAADYLAPQNAEKLLVVGAGNVAAQLPAAFATVRPIQQVTVWNRTLAGAERLVTQWQAQGINAVATDDLESAVREADIVSAATLSTEPLIRGEWLHANQHIDLIGSFTPTMREADDNVFRCAAVFVDSPFAVRESGEILMPIANGALATNDIAGDLYTLTQGAVNYPKVAHHSVFKGAGNAVMDLAAAMTVLGDSTEGA